MDLGLGAPTGLGINGEVARAGPHRGVAPTRADSRGEGFSIGHALNTAIGEGATRVTVLQMALLYAAIANGGQALLAAAGGAGRDADGQVVEEFPPRVRRRVTHLARDPGRRCTRALDRAWSTTAAAPPTGRGRRRSTWRARPAPPHDLSKKREAGTAASGHMRPRLVRRLRPRRRPRSRLRGAGRARRARRRGRGAAWPRQHRRTGPARGRAGSPGPPAAARGHPPRAHRSGDPDERVAAVHLADAAARFDRTLTALIAGLLIGFGLLNLCSALAGPAARAVRAAAVLAGASGRSLFLGGRRFDYRRLARAGLLALRGRVRRCWSGCWSAGGPRAGPSAGSTSGRCAVQPVRADEGPAGHGAGQAHPGRPQRARSAPSSTCWSRWRWPAVPVLLVAAQPDLDTALVHGPHLPHRHAHRPAQPAHLGRHRGGRRCSRWCRCGSTGCTTTSAAASWPSSTRRWTPTGAWQPQQAMNALGSGRLLGKGYLAGHRRCAPARCRRCGPTSPSPLWGEEWGFVGRRR